MESFMRYLLLTWHLMGICQGQLSNLRPLKGKLNDLDEIRNDTRFTTTPSPFVPTTPVRPVIQTITTPISPTRPTQLFTTTFQPTLFAPFQPPAFSMDLPDSDAALPFFPTATPGPPLPPSISPVAGRPISFALTDGVAQSLQQQEVQRGRPDLELELSNRFLAAFRRADREAEEASCVGRALIEATRRQAQMLELPIAEAVEALDMTELDQDLCMEILRNEGCEDFKPPAPCSATNPYRRIDGSCNNLANPTWGRSMTPFVRFHFPAYENGIDVMRGEISPDVSRLPSPRTVSYNLHRIPRNPPLRDITLMVMQWGQFVDHDLVFTAETQLPREERTSSMMINPLLMTYSQPICPVESEDMETVPLECCPNGNRVDNGELIDCRPIDVSQDPLFQSEGRNCMRFVRSLIASKGCELGPREQLNQLTSYLDGSQIYGSTQRVANNLRTFQGGRLQKTDQGQLLPRNCCEEGTFECFRGGDIRVNEQPGLASMHTLWLRVHENLVREFAFLNPHWDDETLYQEARRVVVALSQQIIYREFLPVVVGPRTMVEFDLNLLRNAPGLTYDPTVDASVANVFGTAAFRFGHSLVNDFFEVSGEEVPLVGNFENAKLLFQQRTRPSAFLQGIASSMSQAFDFNLVNTLTNFLFATPEDNVGLDLMSLNIQRGRDHGIPPYTSWRRACDLPTFSNFQELTSAMPLAVAQLFSNIYSDVNEIDLFPAGLSEFAMGGGLVGPTFACIIGQQFSNLKRGDRFFFQNANQPKPFTPDQLRSISSITLGGLICRHTDIQSLQPNVFWRAGLPWNPLYPCSSFPTINTRLWQEFNPMYSYPSKPYWTPIHTNNNYTPKPQRNPMMY